MLRTLQHLQRRTTSGRWIPEIDGLRFVAIAAVVLFHMRGQLAHNGYHPVQPQFAPFVHALDLGRRGVQLFFVISGFILCRPFSAFYLHGEQKPSLRKYLRRRVLRLEPPYIFSIVASAILLQFAWHPGVKAVVLHLAAAIVYLDSWFTKWQGGLPISGVAWSLEVEVQFYLLAPLLTWLLYRLHHPAWRRGLLLALMLAFAAVQQSIDLGPENFLRQAQYFLAGMLLADLNLNFAAHTHQSYYWDLVSAAGWPLIFWVTQAEGYWLAPLTVLLYAGALYGRLFRKLFRVPALALIGGMCYTIYLWHPVAMSLAQRMLGRADTHLPMNYGLYFAIQAAVKIVVIAAVTLPLFLLVERPCMDPSWPSKLRARLQRSEAAGTQPSVAEETSNGRDLAV